VTDTFFMTIIVWLFIFFINLEKNGIEQAVKSAVISHDRGGVNKHADWGQQSEKPLMTESVLYPQTQKTWARLLFIICDRSNQRFRITAVWAMHTLKTIGVLQGCYGAR
jgi:hypothetical protein